jgi:hypothetical protein
MLVDDWQLPEALAAASSPRPFRIEFVVRSSRRCSLSPGSDRFLKTVDAEVLLNA